MILLPVQCRMARAALGLGVRELAAAAKVSIDTVARFERGDELKERTIDALQRALEAAGVEFTNSDRPGVRLANAAAAQPVKRGGASTRKQSAAKPPRGLGRNDNKRRG
jgi:transcriptional regulator with XRE-family HTH domain